MPKTPEQFFQEIAPFVDYLAARWQDESEYEDFAEYQEAVAAKLPEGFHFLAMTRKPFGFKFSAPNMLVFSIKVKGSKIVMQNHVGKS